ncbi:hypothetical protein [Microtetraspora malaysiensis]|uniref:Uncharacterized protein n=1 Tax=Microtetraspora malaysiensis TaxID=161358 RepID=A0ABW6T3J9_9ACTN
MGTARGSPVRREHRRFGTSGFTGVVNQVADIEKSLGIYNLSQFTPRV